MSEPTAAAPRTGYAPVNGLRMYYEVHEPEVHEPEVHEPDRDPASRLGTTTPAARSL